MPSLGLVVEDELRVPDADDLKGARMPVRQHFLARGDDGKEYEILVYVAQRDVTPMDQTHGRSDSDLLPELRTSTGLAVNVLEKGRRYQIVKTGVILESSDPNRFSLSSSRDSDSLTAAPIVALMRTLLDVLLITAGAVTAFCWLVS